MKFSNRIFREDRSGRKKYFRCIPETEEFIPKFFRHKKVAKMLEKY